MNELKKLERNRRKGGLYKKEKWKFLRVRADTHAMVDFESKKKGLSHDDIVYLKFRKSK